MTFENMGLGPKLLARLEAMQITEATPIQTRAIPHAMEGRDILGLAQTGTGKTLAFGLPVADALLRSPEKCQPRSAGALILAPTRELAIQIHAALSDCTAGAHLRLGLVVGGRSINAQIQRMERGAHLLVATPGRLIDLLDRRAITLADTKMLVLDEADQMLDLGFIHALRRIAALLPKERQTLLFSATMPKLMAELAQEYLNDPIRIEVSPPGRTADKVTQFVQFVEPDAKGETLIGMLDGHRDELALVFARTKYGAEKLSKVLDRAGFAAGAIHGNKSQGQRSRALESFKTGEIRVLVATDVAARGIDIPDVRHVYNYELPNVADNYVHRIGRTARAGRDGRAVSLCSRAEMGELRDIERLIGQEVETLGGTRPEDARGERPARKGGGGGRRGRGGAGGGGSARGGKPQARSAGQGRGAAQAEGKAAQGGKPQGRSRGNGGASGGAAAANGGGRRGGGNRRRQAHGAA